MYRPLPVPYIDATIIELDVPGFGVLPLAWFGVLVATGVLVGSWIAEKQGEKMGLDKYDMRWLSTRTVIGGFVISHVFDTIAYHPEVLLEEPERLLYIWAGLSSFGGFLGAAITFWWLTRKEKLPALAFADAIALGLAPAWIFGRAGCYTAHDHPGSFTDFFLAVPYPDGTRHDLGLYEGIVTVFLTIGLWAYARKRRGPGALVAFLAIIYAPTRFALDFLRATDVDQADPRYVGLTPGQWASVACLVFGIWLLSRTANKPPYEPPPPVEKEPSPALEPAAA